MKYHRAVYHHRLGDDPAKDRKLFGDGRDMTDWPGVDLSPDGRWLAITVSQGWSKSEVYVADVRAGRAPVAVAAGEPSKFNVVEMLDDRLYLFTTSGAPRGRLFSRRSGAARPRALARGDQGVGRGPAGRRLLSRRPRGRLAAGRGVAPAPLRRRRRRRAARSPFPGWAR